jgi:hypothetical protein
MGRFMPILRKCSALVNRDDGSGVIVQRIVGNDPEVLTPLNWIFNNLSQEANVSQTPKLLDAIEFYGWEIVREIVLVVMLHQYHREVEKTCKINCEILDERALEVLTASVELGASGVAGIFANVGAGAIAVHDRLHNAALPPNYLYNPSDHLALERSIFGFDHATLGSYMLSEVDFPSLVCDEVFEHTTIGHPIWVAEQLSLIISQSGSGQEQGAEHPIWQTLGLSPARLSRLQRNIKDAANLPTMAFSADAA